MSTIENLENDFWGEPASDTSYLERTIFDLRRKEISEFDIEDFRIMISQSESLNILVPLALERLREDFYAEGDFYPGDLVKAILTSSPQFWNSNPTLQMQMIDLCRRNIENIDLVDLNEKIRSGILEAFEQFSRQAIS